MQAIGDGGGVAPAARRPVAGAEKVARLLLGLIATYARHEPRYEPVLVNGDLGLLIEARLPDGSVQRTVQAFAVAGGQVTGVFSQLNPAKLSRLPA